MNDVTGSGTVITTAITIVTATETTIGIDVGTTMTMIESTMITTGRATGNANATGDLGRLRLEGSSYDTRGHWYIAL